MNNIVQAYNASEYKNKFDFFIEDGLPIPFLKNSKSILIWMSGGADSALLTHFLCNHINKNKLNVEVHILNLIRKWEKAPWQQVIAKRVYNHFIDVYDNIQFNLHEMLIPTSVEHVVFVNKDDVDKPITDFTGGDVLLSNEYCNYLTAKYEIDVNYNATTCNPPVEFTKRVRSRDISCDGSQQSSIKLLGKANPFNSYNCNPFIYTDKSWVIKQYKDNNLLHLLNKTRSCEAYIENTDYKNWYDKFNADTLEDCNTECYWCQERNWALEQNGLLKYKNKFGKVHVF